jgi:hypothetical protein
VALPTDRRHERAVSLLTDALRKPRIEAVLKAWLSALDDVEEELDGFAVGTTDIDVAAGAQLRVLSRIVGSQEVSDDELQRLLVRTRILVVRSSGTGDQILRILNLITDTPYLLEIFPATLLVGVLFETSEAAAQIAFGFMNAARSAGVRLSLLWSTGVEADVYTLASQDDPEFDDESATQLALLAAATSGLAPSRAWFGQTTDAVVSQTLTAVLGAQSNQNASSPTRPLLRQVLRYTGVNEQWHIATGNVIGDLDDIESSMLIAAVYLDGDQVTQRGILGKQNLFATPAVGWNVLVNTSDQIVVNLTSSTGISTSHTFPIVPDTWITIVVLWDRAANLWRSSVSGQAVQSTSIAGLSYESAIPLRIGDSRVNRTDTALRGEVGIAAFYNGAQVEGANVQTLSAALLVALHDESETDSVRGFADTAQTQGGELIDIFGP